MCLDFLVGFILILTFYSFLIILVASEMIQKLGVSYLYLWSTQKHYGFDLHLVLIQFHLFKLTI